MTDDTTVDTPVPAVRYFRDPDGGSIQEVHNLGDDAPYVDSGFEEITEADYLAAVDAIESELSVPDDVEVSD